MSDTAALPTTVEGWELGGALEYVAGVQRPDGLVPWYPDGPADPWDHVESAMGLTVGGRHGAAARAYQWLAETQLEDGSWWAVYGPDAGGGGTRRETHRSAYVATGVWHHYLATGDRSFLRELWPTVERALGFALGRQRPEGEVIWAVDADGEPYEDALVSGCASVALSLSCGAAIARELGHDPGAWLGARERLVEAVRGRGERFDRTWASKADFAMYWFYPVLCGVLTGRRARDRLEARFDEFVEPGLGCRCDAGEPWVTVAESSELVMALAAAGRRERAAALYEWLFQWRDDDGVFWTGFQFEDGVVWPEERPTWTSGAALLAADALGRMTPAAGLFTDHG